MTTRKTVTITAYLDPGQYEALKKLTTVTRVPMAVYIRDAVAKLLAEHDDIVQRNAL
jgi:predicted DNA-binding protein